LTNARRSSTVEDVTARPILSLAEIPPWSRPGRRPGPNPKVRHRGRPDVAGPFSGLITLKVNTRLPSLRERRIARGLGEVFREAGDRGDFRVVRFRIQRDQVEFLVEAADKDALGRGMKSIAARVGRAVNRALERSGPVLRDRYALKVLATPAEIRRVRAALGTQKKL
jgi:REP element-mobilizing transposase RayT